eukprot:NODE_354_length_8925_cov_1.106050.p7 type:complete len:115 gc:universal NODE_354_length_8925_cov_1.106050:7281-7625(+)
MAADRGAYIDQSQSMNVFIAQPDYKKLSSMHFYGWKRGLKTGMYYLRTKPAADAIKFTVDNELMKQRQGWKPDTPLLGKSVTIDKDETDSAKDLEEEILACSIENGEACMMCSG